MKLMNMAAQTRQILLSGPVAAGQTTILSSAVDLTDGGFKGCLFLIHWGAITADGVQSVAIHSSATSGGTYAAITGASVTVLDSDDNKGTVIEVIDPPNPFLKVSIARATQDSAINGIWAIPWGSRSATPSASSTIHGRSVSIGGTAVSQQAIE